MGTTQIGMDQPRGKRESTYACRDYETAQHGVATTNGPGQTKPRLSIRTRASQRGKPSALTVRCLSHAIHFEVSFHTPCIAPRAHPRPTLTGSAVRRRCSCFRWAGRMIVTAAAVATVRTRSRGAPPARRPPRTCRERPRKITNTHNSDGSVLSARGEPSRTPATAASQKKRKYRSLRRIETVDRSCVGLFLCTLYASAGGVANHRRRRLALRRMNRFVAPLCSKHDPRSSFRGTE